MTSRRGLPPEAGGRDVAAQLRVVDQQPRLEVLTVVGEVQAQQLRVAARRAELDPAGQPDEIAPEGDRDVS